METEMFVLGETETGPCKRIKTWYKVSLAWCTTHAQDRYSQAFVVLE